MECLGVKGLLICIALSVASGTQRAPTLTASPSDAYVARGKAHTLRCESDLPKNEVSFTWYLNGRMISTQFDDPDSKFYLHDSGDLYLLAVTPSIVGWYYCNASNAAGFAVSNNATLTFSTLKDEFRVQPDATYTGVVGTSVTLHCTPPKGTPDPQVRWKKDDNELDTFSHQRLAVLPPGNLHIRNLNKSDAGTYKCVAKNVAAERTSHPTTLDVYEVPRILLPPVDLFENEEETARFICVAIGDPKPKVSWSMEGHNLDSTRSTVLADDTLEITDIDRTDDGRYTCTAENLGGAVTATAQLTVRTIPIFLEKPVSKTVGKGGLVTFRCVASGYPQPVIFWKRNAQPDAREIYPTQVKGRLSVSDDGSLQIVDSRVEDVGEYTCYASNAAGQNSTTASLRVREDSASRPPPTITESPSNTTASLNQMVELACTASGFPSPTLRWSHNRQPVLSESADSRISISRGNLRISDVIVTDGGEYTCHAVSEYGVASASAFLKVIGTRINVIETLLPSTPGKPVALTSDIQSTSVKLFWGASADDGDVYYSVEKFTLANQQGWETAIPSTDKSWAQVENLQAGTSYIMLVRAHNAHGTSQPSPVSDFIETSGRPSPARGYPDELIQNKLDSTQVSLLSTDVLSSTAINCSWMLPIAYRRNVQGFHVRLSADRPEQEKSITVYGSESNYLIVLDLQPFTSYTVFVSPFYMQFSGKPSSRSRVITSEDVPSGPPSSVDVREGQRYILVSWNPPKQIHRNGRILGYEIICDAADKRLSRNFSVNSTVMNVALDNLNRETDYRIGVAARTSVGVGVVSKMWPINAILTTVIGNDDSTWWKHTIIGALGGLVWVVLCILIICLCKRRRAQKKARKQTDGDLVTVPLETAASPNNLSFQYKIDNSANTQRHSLSHQQSSALLSPEAINANSFPMSYNEATLDFNEQNMNRQDDSQFKTFYNKSDSMPVGPYATTELLRQRDDGSQAIFSPSNIAHGSESSFTDNNRGAVSNSSGERSSPPVLPSFAEMMQVAPPPQYPPPHPADSAASVYRTGGRGQPMVGTVPRVAPCHTCHRAYHNDRGGDHVHPPIALDPQGRPYNPTMPHAHSFSNAQYRTADYQAYPSMPRGSYQPYNVCMPHGHSSDSHDYAEPQFEQSLYDGVPPLHPPFPRQQSVRSGDSNASRSLLARDGEVPASVGGRHPSLPSSEHSHELCMSCAEQTEYEEPWSNQQWPLMLDPHHQHMMHRQHQHQQQHQQQASGEGEEEKTEETPMLEGEGSAASSADDGSHTGQSKSGSDDSKTGRQKQRRRQRAQQLPVRPSSPYNGYSTDSSAIVVPRKPYPKSQRKKQMNSKSKTTKSLAVQVEQEEMAQDKV